MKAEIPRNAMSNEERSLRSKAAKLLSQAGLLHGSLSTRYQKCGQENCRCTRGQKHQVFVLVLRKDGQRQQIPIPRDLVDTGRQWLEQEKTRQGLLARISELQAQRIVELKRKRSGG